MRKYALTILLSFILLILTGYHEAYAQGSNNKFGIHIIDEHDLKDAAALVNSNGGEWGYVTLVIREDQRDALQWQRVMDEMRRLKLIPIVRIATKMESNHWAAPTEAEAVNWAGFLNSLNWPTKTRYVVLFNEPNHAKEWGGEIDPAGFAKMYRHYYETLKGFSGDFFILPGALDLAASNTAITMEASQYFERMHTEDNYIFNLYDGLNSHSYPNPGFSGNATDTGKSSIKGYKWELEYLSTFGLRGDVPVFITETGWINGSGNLEENYKYAYEQAWSDPQIVAVTPFVLNYLDKPFADFSWRDPDTREFYPQYYSVQSITKLKGEPEQIHLFEFTSHNIADYLVSDSEYLFSVELKNMGQSIWNREDGFRLVAETSMNEENLALGEVPSTEPNQTAKINVRLTTNEPRGIHDIKLMFFKNEKKIADVVETKFTLVSPPSLNIFARFWFGENDHSANLEIYDKDTLVNRFENLSFKDGKAFIPSVKNVIPNRDYRFILSKPFFLPVETTEKLYVGKVDIKFGRLVPFDLDSSGKIDVNDIVTHLINPLITNIRILSL